MIKKKKKKIASTHLSNLPRSFQFACCGINGSSNYGTSWWRLQEVGRRELVVPLSCCTLNNVNQTDSFLNPEPANLTLCQALNPAEHQYARHTTVRISLMRMLLNVCGRNKHFDRVTRPVDTTIVINHHLFARWRLFFSHLSELPLSSLSKKLYTIHHQKTKQ